ncbi:MAG: hypothetical protein DDT32_00505 [Syntrophomonadaceae bacterium]|nr:hypothetical protein [Bacillota bacterium]
MKDWEKVVEAFVLKASEIKAAVQSAPPGYVVRLSCDTATFEVEFIAIEKQYITIPLGYPMPLCEPGAKCSVGFSIPARPFISEQEISWKAADWARELLRNPFESEFEFEVGEEE